MAVGDILPPPGILQLSLRLTTTIVIRLKQGHRLGRIVGTVFPKQPLLPVYVAELVAGEESIGLLKVDGGRCRVGKGGVAGDTVKLQLLCLLAKNTKRI